MFKQMIGKRYLYNAKEYLIEDANWAGEHLFVNTDKKTFRIHKDEVKKMHSQFLPVEGDNSLVVKEIAPQINSLKTVTESLIECITKVKEDPGYIKQANSINTTIKTITQVMRLELDMMKLKNK